MPFVAKRALRIVPAYATVVLVCALALGPWWTELARDAYFRHPQTWAYLRNISFVELHFSLPGVFVHNPFPHAVNGSIWTLPVEASMYVALTALGCLGLATRAGVSALTVVLAVIWFGWGAALDTAPPIIVDVLPASFTVHLALWFFVGSAFWVWRERIRYRADVALALLAAMWLSQGSPVGSIVFHGALPYLVFWTAQLPVKGMNRFGRHGDFSYGMYLYAFPVQQTLTWLGGALWPQLAYIAVCLPVTLVFAVASWHLVERHALRLKPRRRPRDVAPLPAEILISRKTAGRGGA
jgi:peptidoglycan/LPS O-acetylase OafA/YrhL